MEGKVASDAESYSLPYTVLVARDSDVIEDYSITTLPRLVIVKKDGVIALTEKFLLHARLRKEVEKVVQ